jgi:hypothetical protein
MCWCFGLRDNVLLRREENQEEGNVLSPFIAVEGHSRNLA